MDPFDDFKMKPLTKGLGFHKKALQMERPKEKSEALEEVLAKTLPTPPPRDFLQNQAKENSDTLEELMNSLNMPTEDFGEPQSITGSAGQGQVQVSAVLPRNTPTPISKGENVFLDPFPSELGMLDKQVRQQRAPQSEQKINQKQRSTQQGSATNKASQGLMTHGRKLCPASFGFQAVVLDITVGITLALVFLLSLLTVTKVDLMAVVGNLQTDATTQLSLALLYLSVMGMYLVVSRSFFGLTLGEWTFDYQLGNAKDQKSAWFPLLVIWRTFITLATGIVVLPFLSLIFQIDLACPITGLQLYEKR